MSRRSRARDYADAITRWSAPTTAIAIDRGLVEQWPFELTRAGRRFRSWDRLIAGTASAMQATRDDAHQA